MKKLFASVVYLLSTVVCPLLASAQAPQLINYQGRLLNGTNLVNGNVGLSLRLYGSPSLGSPLYEDSNTVLVADGLYSTIIGDNTITGTLADALTNAALYIEVAVEGVALTPRERVTSVLYALRAGGVGEGAITAGMLADGAVTSNKLAAGAVTATALATNAVGSVHIADGSIVESDLAANTISSGALAKDYRSGSQALTVPAEGLVSNIVVSYGATFASAPFVTVNLSLPVLPSGLDILARVIVRRTNEFTCAVDVGSVPPSWNLVPVAVETGTNILGPMTAALVSGNPALVTRLSGSTLQFARANNASGSVWSSGTFVPTAGQTAIALSMLAVATNAAVVWQTSTGGVSYVRANNASGSSWPATPTTVVASPTNNPLFSGQFPDLDIVSGNPAIAYIDKTSPTSGLLRFVRASDTTGTVWSAPVTARTASDALPEDLSLEMVGASPMPALAYREGSSLAFIRANSSSGNAWPAAPIVLDSVGDTGVAAKLLVVGGQPAIVYVDASTETLKFIRAADTDGASWATPPVTVVASNAAGPLAFFQANGNPAVVFFDDALRAYRFVRAANSTGTSWGSPVTVSVDKQSAGTVWMSGMTGSVPVVVYYDSVAQNVKAVAASNASGTAWNTPKPASSSGTFGQFLAAGIVSNNPSVVFFDGLNSAPRFRRASSSSGSSYTGAGTFVTTDNTDNDPCHLTILPALDRPAVTYLDGNNIRFVVASNGTGTAWGTPTNVANVSGLPSQHDLVVRADGVPCIVYSAGNFIAFEAADNTSGTTWNSGAFALPLSGSPTEPDLLLVNQNPAIFARITEPPGLPGLVFTRATNTSGTGFAAPVVIDNVGDTGHTPSAAIVDGQPAVAYYDATLGNLRYARAGDADGVQWGTPRTLDSEGNTGLYPSLFIVAGKPVIAYHHADEGSIRYIAAKDAQGDEWHPPQIAYQSPAPSTLLIPAGLVTSTGAPYIFFHDAFNLDLRAVRTTSTSYNGALEWIAVEP